MDNTLHFDEAAHRYTVNGRIIPSVTQIISAVGLYEFDFVSKQTLAIAALRDKDYFEDCVEKIRLAREMLRSGLLDLGFEVVPSETNFLFASPPDGDGERCFNELRARNILVRYFPYPRTKAYVRISIGTSVQIVKVWAVLSELYGKGKS